jgi:hypothetical protein
MRVSLSFHFLHVNVPGALLHPRFLLGYLCAIILYPLAPAYIASLMCSTTRQKLAKRLFPTAAHLPPITLMVLSTSFSKLFLSPLHRLCAFLGRPLMTNLRDSTSTLSNDRTGLTSDDARSFVCM